MKNLTIGRKLGLACAALLAVLLVCGVVAAHTVGRVEARLAQAEGPAVEAASVAVRNGGNVLLVFLAVGLFAGVGVATLIGRNVVVSIGRLTEGARRLGGGELGHRIEVGSGDELGELAAAFNEMAEKRQAAEAEITRLNAALEERVEERTRRLRELVENLEHSEGRYRAVVEQASESIFISDARTKRILQSNAALQNLLGYPAEELSGMTLYDFIEDSREAIDGNEARIRADGTYHLGERLYRRKDGDLVPVESSASLIRFGDGGEAFCTVAVDMTERKRSQEALRKSESGLAEAQRIARLGSWEYGIAEDEARWSEEMYRIFGLSPETFVPTYGTFLDRVHPGDRRRLRRALFDSLRRGGRGDVECRILRPDGEERVLHARYESAAGASGKPVRVYGTVQDITERKRAERKERELARYNRSLFEINLDALMTLDTEGSIVDANPALTEMLGLSRRELLGSAFLDHVDDPESAWRWVQRCLKQGYARDFEVEFRGPDGRLIPAVCNGTVYHDAKGGVAGILGSAHDVTERKEFERQLEHQAFHDPLTGLPNRALFMDRLEHALERARREEEEGVAVLFMDLDRFKIVNDSLGHGGGDRLLRDVKDRLLSCLRPYDTLARVGGDEFCVLLEKVSGYEDAVSVARRVRDVLRTPFIVAGHEAVVSTSIGIALGVVGSEARATAMGIGGVSGEGLLRNADLAMYAAKRRAKGDYEIFDPRMNEEARVRLKKESDLRRAIEREELRVYYQPKTDLLTGRISGFEALVRWESPERGLVSPADFVPLAEETGLIIPIGRWVLREACRQVKAWQERFPSAPDEPPLSISVNVSGQQMQAHRGDIVWEVERALSASGLEPRSLQLEITESVLMEDVPANIATLIRLKSRGVRLAIDDFGTGYSSLSYLERFPVDTLKIDRSFVGRLGPDHNSGTLVETMVRLGRSLGLEVIAEGVETADQLARLTELGCDEGQGFYFSRPIPAADVAETLKNITGVESRE